MEVVKNQEKILYYQRVLCIWEGFCEFHKELYDLTCDEYLTLLASDIDKLETMLPLKEEIIAKIGELENERSELIEKINDSGVITPEIGRAGELISAFSDLEEETGVSALKNLNSLLIEIVERIQEQNRKNQLFLNKAMLSIRDIKQGFSGKKTYSTYGADGLTRTLNR